MSAIDAGEFFARSLPFIIGIAILWFIVSTFKGGASTSGSAQAAAYAKHRTPVFVSNYIEMARNGRGQQIPPQFRNQIIGFVKGQPVSGPDVNTLVYQMLYEHRIRTGRDHPLP